MNHSHIYIQSLKNLLNERRNRNQKYSMRALARDIGVDPGYLVHIMNGDKKVTPKIAYKLAAILELESDEMLNFIIPALL